MTPSRLTGPEQIELRNLLAAAFTRPRFRELLLGRLDQRFDDFVGAEVGYRDALLQIVQDANAGLWWRDLLTAARQALPSDPGLLAFAQRFELAPQVGLGGGALELKIRQSNSIFDLATWLARLGEIEGQVCRVEVSLPDGLGTGTGFLVGPDVVLTNYHVVKAVIDGDVPPASVALRFDYRYLADGVTPAPGTVHRLAEEWKVDHSPFSRHDVEVPPSGEPSADELDYAVLRLAARAGEEPVGGPTDDGEWTPRGWLKIPATDHDFTKVRALYIVQHADGKPLQVAIDSEAVLGLNNAGTRVRYTTNTEPGSSGSPCFGPDWQWVAVHHAGDPRYPAFGVAEYNQGIPVSALRTAAAFGP
ncbi:trypsin-like peptidase domain-containing protein [Dactylosporangium cerinum]|uniref:Trypsin-like peptidase domain-containing protein n=1 Tax=Dactylosporangium cerinum TaxID=1434730 RepID=A0ABV9W873_9ACTN